MILMQIKLNLRAAETNQTNKRFRFGGFHTLRACLQIAEKEQWNILLLPKIILLVCSLRQ